MAGFADGNGCFRINIIKYAIYRLGVSINLCFILTQDIRDKVLIRSFDKFLNCGGFSIAADGLSCEYHVYRLSDILNAIIPFYRIWLLLNRRLWIRKISSYRSQKARLCWFCEGCLDYGREISSYVWRVYKNTRVKEWYE